MRDARRVARPEPNDFELAPAGLITTSKSDGGRMTLRIQHLNGALRGKCARWLDAKVCHDVVGVGSRVMVVALVDAAVAGGADGAGVLLGTPDAGGDVAGASNRRTVSTYCGVCCCSPWLSL